MFVTHSDILDLFKKEKRPLLLYEIVHKFSSEPEEEFEIVPDQEFGQRHHVPIYIWDKTGLNSHTKRKAPYYFHPEMLEKFWLNEIRYILKKKNDEVDIETMIDELGRQVVNYYGLLDPLGTSFDITSDAGLGDEKEAKLLSFLKKHDDLFYVHTGKAGLFKKSLFVGLVEWKDKVLEEDRKIIRNEMIKVLRINKTKTLSLKDLTYIINRTQLDTLISKPFDVKLIKTIVHENLGRVIYDKSNETISLSDDLDYITNYFKEIRQPYSNIEVSEGPSGLLAYVFIGNEFPLREAVEYVKTRPIIFIDEIHQGIDVILFGTSKNSRSDYEFREYLKAVMDTSDDEKIDIWLSENVTLSYYKEGSDQVKLLAPKIIEKFSPVFNVDKNPGNLFQYTLKTKLDKYYEKNPNKKLFGI